MSARDLQLAEAFQTISLHYQKRAMDFYRIIESGYSFEEWSNWEALFSCIEAGYAASPKPLYSDFVETDKQMSGDLAIRLNDDKTAIIEFGTVHDYTADKWIDKLNKDHAKLSTLSGKKGVLPVIFLILGAQDISILDEKKWASWLKYVCYWNQHTPMQFDFPLVPNGQIICRAWVIA